MNDISATPAMDDGQATADAAADCMFYVVSASEQRLSIIFCYFPRTGLKLLKRKFYFQYQGKESA